MLAAGEQGELVEVELHPVSTGVEIVDLTELGHRAVAAVDDKTRAARKHLAPEGHVGERLVHLELELEVQGVPRRKEVAPGRPGVAGDDIGDDDPALRQHDRFPGSGLIRLLGRERHRDLAGQKAVAKGPDRLTWRADGDDLAVLDDDDAVTDLAHEGDRVRDDDDRPALGLELVDTVQALLLEALVADGEHLVDEQHVGLNVHRHREPEADVHARGVEADLVVDELLQLGEGDDVIEAPGDVAPRKAQQGSVQVDVVPAGQLRLETGAELQHRRQVTPDDDLA